MFEKLKIVLTGDATEFNATMDDVISNIKSAVGDMQMLDAIVEQASQKDFDKLKTSLQGAKQEQEELVSSIQKQILVMQQAINMGNEVDMDAFKMLGDDLKFAQKGLSNVEKTMANLGVNSKKGFGAFAESFGSKLSSVQEKMAKLGAHVKKLVFSSLIFKGIMMLQTGIQNAIKLSDTANGNFTALGNIFSGILIPVVEWFSTVIMKAIVWVGGLIKYLTGFDIIAKGINATNKSIKKLGTTSKSSGKKIKDGLLSGLDEITNISQPTDSGGGGGISADLGAQLGAMTSLKDAMAQMNALDFSWAEPLKNALSFIMKHGGVLGTLLTVLAVGFVALQIATLAWNVALGLSPINWWIVAVGGLLTVIALMIIYWEDVCATVRWVWDWITSIIKTKIDEIIGKFRAWWEFANMIFNGIITFAQNCVNGVVSWFSTLPSRIGVFVDKARQWITDTFGGLGAWFGGIITDIVEWFKTLPKKISDAVGKMYNKVIEWFGDIGNTIAKTISSYITSAINGVIKGAYGVVNWFIKKINGVIDFVNKIPGVNLTKMNLLEVPKFDVGTNYVPHDMIAQVHKGERIVPKKYNHKDFEGKETDMEPTNALLMELIDLIDRKPMGITKDAIGKASVDYIKTESRRRGGLII